MFIFVNSIFAQSEWNGGWDSPAPVVPAASVAPVVRDDVRINEQDPLTFADPVVSDDIPAGDFEDDSVVHDDVSVGDFDDAPVVHDDVSGDLFIDDLSVEIITEPVIDHIVEPAAVTVPAAPPVPADLPRIAVYVAGNLPEDEKNALSTRMLASLVNSGRYRGIERGGAFLAEIDREQEHQRSGAVDDAQIMALGRQFGVRYICIAAITPAFGTFQVSARIVDVETAEVIFIGESYSLLESADDFTQVSDKVVRIMFGESEPDPPPVVYLPAPMTQQHSRFRLVIRLSTGALAVGGLVGGIVFDNMVKEEYDRYRDFSTDPENPRGTDAENYDKVQTMRRNIDSNIMMRNVLYGVAAIGLTGFAVTLFF